MPKRHQKQMDWTASRFLSWSRTIGPNTLRLTEHILESKKHPEQGYRASLGLLNLAKLYGSKRLEDACQYGWETGARSRKSIASILEIGLDRQPQEQKESINLGLHDNVRGSHYYH